MAHDPRSVRGEARERRPGGQEASNPAVQGRTLRSLTASNCWQDGEQTSCRRIIQHIRIKTSQRLSGDRLGRYPTTNVHRKP